jgi:hypothetical protein
VKTAPLVSGIVPCRNGSSYLAQVLDSIGAVGAVVPAPVRRRLGPVLRSWIEG